jgi:metal-dependent amidase/aminoacylase/carboxypeptidase family protein
MKKTIIFALFLVPLYLWAQDNASLTPSDYLKVYQQLHAHPELSGQEKNTADFLKKTASILGLYPTRLLGVL